MAAGNSVRVNTDQVAQIATKIESLNTQLREQLEISKTKVNNLSNVWTGEASQTTISAFNEFAGKYFENYEEIIASYVRFLRTNVEQGYFETETSNIELGQSFK